METAIELKTSAPAAGRTLNISIGGVVCALRCSDDQVYRRLGDLYRRLFALNSASVQQVIDERGNKPAGKPANGPTGQPIHKIPRSPTKGLLRRSSPMVVVPMCPGYTVVRSPRMNSFC